MNFSHAKSFKNSSTTERENLQLLNILQGTLFCFIIVLCGYIISSIVIYVFNVSSSSISLLSNTLGIISAAFGGGYAAWKSQSKGWLNGALVGISFILVSLILGFITGGIQISAIALILNRLLWGFLTGAIGGMIGVNFAR